MRTNEKCSKNFCLQDECLFCDFLQLQFDSFVGKNTHALGSWSSSLSQLKLRWRPIDWYYLHSAIQMRTYWICIEYAFRVTSVTNNNATIESKQNRKKISLSVRLCTNKKRIIRERNQRTIKLWFNDEMRTIKHPIHRLAPAIDTNSDETLGYSISNFVWNVPHKGQRTNTGSRSIESIKRID